MKELKKQPRTAEEVARIQEQTAKVSKVVAKRNKERLAKELDFNIASPEVQKRLDALEKRRYGK